MNYLFSQPDGFTLGGVTTWTTEMCNRLAISDNDVHIAKHLTFNPLIDIHINPKVNVKNIDEVHADSPFIRLKHVKKFADTYSSNLPVILIPNWSNGTYASCAYMSQTCAAQMRVIGYVHTDEQLYYDWLEYYEPIIHQFVCVSNEIQEKLSRLLPHRVGDMVIKPYAVNVPETLNRDYSPHATPLKIIYAGRISQTQKRIFDLIPLIQELERQKIEFEFRIIGDGMEYNSLERGLAQLPISTQSKVSLEPSLQPAKMAETWRWADVFISVSEYEGTSIAMLEAMGQGCVPIVTAVSGTEAVISNGENGFFHNVGDVESMATSLNQLSQDRDKLTSMGEQAYSTIRQRYSYDDYIHWFTQTAEMLWTKPDRIWPENKALIPPKLGAIKKEELTGAIQGDPSSIRILLHKILHLTHLAGPFYFLKGLMISLRRILTPNHA